MSYSVRNRRGTGLLTLPPDTRMKEKLESVSNSGVPRNELFLTTKLYNSDMRNSERFFFKSLGLLGTPNLDQCEQSSYFLNLS